jgi:hypothetical protein
VRALLPSLGFGLFLVAFGAFLLRSHVVSWRRQQADPEVDEIERRHLGQRYRRRMQASGLIVAVGVILPAGDALLTFRHMPLGFAFYVGLLLVLTAWILVLGVGDWFATAAHARVALRRLDAKQRALERELEDLRRKGRASGAE